MNTEIFYFSGTGNSLFVAKELQKRIPESELIPIVCMLKRDKILSTGSTVGIVFPVHALTIPIAVSRFIKKIDLSNAKYVFAVATRGGGTIFYGFKKINNLLRKQKKFLSSEFIIDMYSNESRTGTFIPPIESDIETIEQDALRKLDTIEEMILKKGNHREDIRDHKTKSGSNPISSFMIERLVLALMEIADHTKGANYFYHDDKCTGCGVCEKVCLSEKIKMVDGRPVWQRDVLCYMCFACLNFCPVRSVQINDIPGVKSHTKENERYSHPYASICDISKQKD